jgi:hypothetical protein
MSDWISVDERLPEEDEQVLCWCKVESDGWSEVASHHNSFFTDSNFEFLEVTHWQPLPDPPSTTE